MLGLKMASFAILLLMYKMHQIWIFQRWSKYWWKKSFETIARTTTPIDIHVLFNRASTHYFYAIRLYDKLPQNVNDMVWCVSRKILLLVHIWLSMIGYRCSYYRSPYSQLGKLLCCCFTSNIPDNFRLWNGHSNVTCSPLSLSLLLPHIF